MALQVWLPLNGDLHNQGLNNITITNNNAIINNNGKFGQCYQFGTSGSDITLPTSVMTSYTTECSVTFWLNILTQLTAYATYFLAGPAGIAWTSYIFGFLRNNTSSTCCFTISDGSSASNANYLTPALDLNTWYHIALIYKTGHCLIYINGILSHDYSTSIIPDFTKITTIKIGRAANSSSYLSNCLMNDFRIYDHALSAKEVEEISKGLILHYPLNHNGLGGENMLSNSTGYNGNTAWNGQVTVDYENGQPYLIAKRVNTTSSSRTFCTHTAITSLISSWMPGESFTISGYYKVPSSETQDVTANMFIRWAQSSSSNTDTDTGFYTSNTIKDTWIRFEKTFVVPAGFASGKTVNFYLSAFSQGLATVYWKNIKLEKGDHATRWSPAKADAIYPDNYDTIIYDCSGYNNNGEVVDDINYITSSPRYNCASIFDSGQYIKKTDLHFVNNIWSVSCWFKKTSNLTNTYETILGYTKGNGADANKKFSIYTYNNKIGCVAEKTGGTSAVTINADLWHHVCLVNNAGSYTCYLDGVSIKTFTNTNCLTDCTDFVVGGRAAAENATSIGTPWTGYVSDVRFYATALTIDQVKELYNTSMSIDVNGNIYARELVE